MELKAKEFKELCKVILGAVDGTSSQSIVSETLELKVENKKLYLSVTNREYFVTVKMFVDTEESLRAVVDAKKFLSLISKITSETIDLSVVDNSLLVKANGNYKLAFISDQNGVVELPKIDLETVTVEQTISKEVLQSISTFNSRELLINKTSAAVNKNTYYLDGKGAITYNSCRACVNNFDLEKDVKLVLSSKLLKLFGLFKKDTKFQYGFDQVGNVTQAKIKLEDEDTCLTSLVLNDTNLLASIPVDALRRRANDPYTYSVDINKDDLAQTINRLMVLNDRVELPAGKFVFDKDKVTIYDIDGVNNETISYVTTTLANMTTPYETKLYLNDMKSITESCDDKIIKLNFGNTQAIMVSRGDVKNVIPELHG